MLPDEVTRTQVTVLREDIEPGEEDQIGSPLLGQRNDPRTGKGRRIWAFVMVLPCSRHMFVRPVLNLHDVRLVSSAATNEYGQPGTIWCLPSLRPNVWQKDRSAQVLASGRSHGETSTAPARAAPALATAPRVGQDAAVRYGSVPG